jgi:hypothetical protein
MTNYVGINTVGNTAYSLDVAGTTRNNTGAWVSGSDQRVKNNIVDADLVTCYSNVHNLKLRHFQWDESYATSNMITDTSVVGWIAQEVQQVFPKAVFASQSWGYSNFLDVSTDQITKTMYGALQLTMARLEQLTDDFAAYKAAHP